ncbi:hypothetical protein [Histidinibacterium aquaticum]|uniref:hypothetical protein n=1 Tax=Histidinibacterium aquaticum TaxID=2613962 RepID=UPI00168ACD82|nr:hypothetical protein [Histidinibacterium aquaticum]
MERKKGQDKGRSGREDRLKSALKANLQRRKRQARERSEQDRDDESSRDTE